MLILLTPRQHQRHNTQLRKFGLVFVDDLLRIWAEGGVADDAELDAAAVAQDGDTQADTAALGHPEEALLKRRAAEFQFFFWTWHIGHHGSCLLGEQVQHRLLRWFDKCASQSEHAKR